MYIYIKGKIYRYVLPKGSFGYISIIGTIDKDIIKPIFITNYQITI